MIHFPRQTTQDFSAGWSASVAVERLQRQLYRHHGGRIPGFLVIAAFLYAVLASGSMVFIARALIHRPNIIVMDGATAAMDPLSQEQLTQLTLERLPEATVVSVGHRTELEAFHTRKLVLEYHPVRCTPGR